jgi:hypothetical protein
MKKNIGTKNRAARFVIGLLLLAVSVYYLQDAWMLIGSVVGAFMMVEAAAGFCLWHSIRGTSDMR